MGECAQTLAQQGRLSDPPPEILEHQFLTEFRGYTRAALDIEDAQWVHHMLIISNAFNQIKPQTPR